MKNNKKKILKTLTLIPEVASELESTYKPNAKMQEEIDEFYIIGDDLSQSTLSDSKNTAEQEDLNKAQIFNSKITSPTQEIKKIGYFASLVKKAKSLLSTKGQGR